MSFLSTPARAPRRVMMHVMDAGSGMIEFECRTCGHNTGWIVDERTVTENKRGLPCPKCNKGTMMTEERRAEILARLNGDGQVYETDQLGKPLEDTPAGALLITPAELRELVADGLACWSYNSGKVPKR